MSYGGVNFGAISEDKHTDITQLKDEVDQIRIIMNQLRVSEDSAMSMQGVPVNSINDQRSSLLSILSKVKKQSIDKGASQPLNIEDRESIASYFRQNKNQTQQIKEMTGEDLTGDNWQPSLQMFESLVSLMSQPTSKKQDVPDSALS